MSNQLIKENNIKKFTKHDISKGFKKELEKKTIDKIKEAEHRCRKNKRTRLLPQDL